jgi:hypothetical protein
MGGTDRRLVRIDEPYNSKVLVKKLIEICHLENIGVDGRIILNWIINK